MIDSSFEINGKQFKLSKINALKQFHIVRKIGPILSDMVPVLQKIAKENTESKSESEKLESAGELAGPIMLGLSRLSDKDAEFVLFNLLAAVEMNQGSNWARISNGEVLMFDNLDMPTMLNAAGRAFMFNMSGFFAALQRGS